MMKTMMKRSKKKGSAKAGSPSEPAAAVPSINEFPDMLKNENQEEIIKSMMAGYLSMLGGDDS